MWLKIIIIFVSLYQPFRYTCRRDIKFRILFHFKALLVEKVLLRDLIWYCDVLEHLIWLWSSSEEISIVVKQLFNIKECIISATISFSLRWVLTAYFKAHLLDSTYLIYCKHMHVDKNIRCRNAKDAKSTKLRKIELVTYVFWIRISLLTYRLDCTFINNLLLFNDWINLLSTMKSPQYSIHNHTNQ